MKKLLTTQAEVRIVALIARGDTYATIQSQLKKEGIDITIPTISKIKSRNEEALKAIKGEMIKVESSKSATILEKSRNLIEKKLDKTEDETIPQELQDAYDNGEIDAKQFLDRKQTIFNKRQVSIGELNMVAKEAFNQSQIESGKPTSITDSPEQAKKNLERLLTAINSGKEEDIVKAIFLDA